MSYPSSESAHRLTKLIDGKIEQGKTESAQDGDEPLKLPLDGPLMDRLEVLMRSDRRFVSSL